MCETLDTADLNITPVPLPDVDPSARITRVMSLPASPGCCALCGKTEHPKGFAATDNFDFEFFGTPYFCGDCIGDYARVFGFISPENLQDVMQRLANQDEELDLLRRSVTNLETLVDAYAKLHLDSGIVPPSGTLVIGASEDAPEPVLEAEGRVLTLVAEPSNEGTGEEPDVNEPATEQRRDDVPSTTSNDLTDFLADL